MCGGGEQKYVFLAENRKFIKSTFCRRDTNMLIMVVSQERWMSLDKVRRNLTAFSSWKIKICANFLQTKKRKNFIFIWEGCQLKIPLS